MAFQPIWGLVLRHARLWKHDYNLILMALYWPLLDVLIWGFLGSWIQRTQNIPNYTLVALLGILLLQASCRAPITIVVGLCEELWSNNLVNLFSLPIRLYEWIIGIIIFTAFVTTFVACCSVSLIWLIYHLSLVKLMTAFLLFAPPLFISGIWLGFVGLQVIVTFGRRATEIGFIVGWFFMPFSGAFYPIEALPAWARAISSFLPMSYVLEGMRNYILTDANPVPYLIKGYALALLYATLSVALFVYAFNRSKIKGLRRLSD
jgi:ABC-2 type transport system permease protein